jgi:hypothetical protein
MSFCNWIRRRKKRMSRKALEAEQIVAREIDADERPHRAKFWLALQIVDDEARRDVQGNIVLYGLPHGDGGGWGEYAGINSTYHPEMFAQLHQMDPPRREIAAAAYIDGYFRKFLKGSWPSAAVEYLMMDACFNRGPAGSTVIAQWALRRMGYVLDADGKWGPKTRSLLETIQEDRDDTLRFIQEFRMAREDYERETDPAPGIQKGARDESDDFWQGLVNRWNDTTTFAASIA